MMTSPTSQTKDFFSFIKGAKLDKTSKKNERREGRNRTPRQPNYGWENMGYCYIICVMGCMLRGAQHIGRPHTTSLTLTITLEVF